MSLVRLIATQGSDECNFRGERYRVNPSDSIVWVDELAVGPLVAIGGYVLADPVPLVRPAVGSVRLAHPDPLASCTVGGVSYLPVNGAITVPVQAAAALRDHGWAPVWPRR